MSENTSATSNNERQLILFALGKGNYGIPIENVFEIKESKSVIKEETSATMRELLERVVSNGSGKGAGVNGYSVAGKTGTAQKYENGTIAQGKYISSFLGFSLEDDAPYGVLMIVDEPKGYVYYGSLVAAPLVGDIYRSIFDLLAVPKSNDLDIESGFNPENIEDYVDFVEYENWNNLQMKSANIFRLWLVLRSYWPY